MFKFQFGKGIIVFGFLRFLSSFFICMRRNWLFNPACKTSCVKDTYQPQTAIPFKIEENNSSKIFAIVSIWESFCRVSVPVYLQFLVATLWSIKNDSMLSDLFFPDQHTVAVYSLVALISGNYFIKVISTVWLLSFYDSTYK